jgi:hypothetical protein
MSEAQAVVFELTSGWNPKTARSWLRDRGYKPIKPVHRTGQSLRYRLNDPKKYSSFITKQLGQGIKLIIGFST